MVSCILCIATGIALLCCASCPGRWGVRLPALQGASGRSALNWPASAVVAGGKLRRHDRGKVRVVGRLGAGLQAVGKWHCFQLAGFKLAGLQGGHECRRPFQEPVHVQAGQPCCLVLRCLFGTVLQSVAEAAPAQSCARGLAPFTRWFGACYQVVWLLLL
jgi:hypothetical protein